MQMPSIAFTSLAKRHNPLADELRRRAQPLYDDLRAAKSPEAIDALTGSAQQRIRSMTPDAPRLGGTRDADIRELEDVRTSAGDAVRGATHYYAVQVLGEALLLTHWPSAADHVPAIDEVGPLDEPLTVQTPVHELWELNVPVLDADHLDNEWALYTKFILTVDEEAAVAGHTLDLNPLFASRLDRVRPIAEMIQKEVVDYFHRQLPEDFERASSERREELENRRAVARTLVFPETWKMKPIRLDEHEAGTVQRSSSTGRKHGAQEVSVHQRVRLSAASFADLQKTIRLWADAIERYPGSFGKLGEDDLSDLLCATLNATLPGAQREVFTRSGKSDIYVKADVLSEGTGPAEVFIAESKKATSKAVVTQALDPQLFGYLADQDLDAVLLLFVPQVDFRRARNIHLRHLRDEVAGFEEESASAVAGWPIYRYARDGRVVQVCVATIHVPPKAAHVSRK